MPLNIAASDRRLFLWIGAITLPLIFALAFLSSSEQEGSVLPSTWSTKSGGAKAAYLLLGELGYAVERWDDTPGNLPMEAEGTVLVMALPTASPLPQERAALRNYLVRGGKILISGTTVDSYVPDADTETEPLPSPISKVYVPRLVTSITRGGPIEMAPGAYWKKRSTSFLVHYEDEGRPIVVSYGVGRGQIIWWASSSPLSNADIGRSGNLNLLLNSLGEAGRVRVLWDEYFHGERRSLTTYIGETALRWGLWQGVAVFLAVIVTFSRRNGPVRPAYETPRLSPLEFVETLGNLYRRARAAGDGIEVPYTRFKLFVTRRLGLPGNLSAKEVARAVHDRMGYKDQELGPLLARIEAGVGRSDLDEKDALEMLQQLNRHTRKLGLDQTDRRT